MKRHLSIIIAAFLAISCTEYIAVKTNSDDETMLVIDALLTTRQERFCTKLTITSPYSNDTTIINVFSGASVKISDGEEEITLEEDGISGCYYTPEIYRASPGKTYTLTIDCTFNGESRHYESTETMPQTGFTLTNADYYDMEGKSTMFCIWGKDDPDMLSNLVMTFEVNGIGYPYRKWTLYDHSSYAEGVELVGAEILRYNGWINDEGYTKDLKKGDIVDIHFYTACDSFWDFLSGVQDEVGGLNIPIISPQPANIPCNISGGALGCFALANDSHLTLTIDNPHQTKEEMTAKYMYDY